MRVEPIMSQPGPGGPCTMTLVGWPPARRRRWCAISSCVMPSPTRTSPRSTGSRFAAPLGQLSDRARRGRHFRVRADVAAQRGPSGDAACARAAAREAAPRLACEPHCRNRQLPATPLPPSLFAAAWGRLATCGEETPSRKGWTPMGAGKKRWKGMTLKS